MSPSTSLSAESRGALYLVVIGVVGVLMGLYFAATGLADVLSGHWLSPSGGIGSLIVGVSLVAAGLFLGQRGRSLQRLLKQGTGGGE